MVNTANTQSRVKKRELPMPVEAQGLYGLNEQSWKVLTEVTFPNAKSTEAILMALDYCRARKLDIFKKPVHIVPMWSSALGRNVETVWPSITEIQTTAARTGDWAGMDRPVWGLDITQTFTGRYKDDQDQWHETSVTVTFPEWVAVTVYRMVGGKRCPFTEEVYWLESYGTAGGKASTIPTSMWQRRPRGQLAKCGKAASLRAAFPEEIGYTAEEMDSKTLDDANGLVIDGESHHVDAGLLDTGNTLAITPEPVIVDIASLPAKTRKAVAELVRRTSAAGAWEAAFDYARAKFSGQDLAFALSELHKAKTAGQAAESGQSEPDKSVGQAA